jgi:hypothetical protein
MHSGARRPRAGRTPSLQLAAARLGARLLLRGLELWLLPDG